LHAARVVSLATTLLLLPFAVVLAYFTTDPVFSYAVNLYLFDVPLAVLIVTAAPLLVVRARARGLGIGMALWAIIVALVALSFLFNPSLEGVQALWRITGVLAIAVTFAELSPRERAAVIGALAIGAVVQTVWAVAQVMRGAPLGAWWLFESQKPLPKAGDAWIPKGTMQTPYLLATLALVSTMLAAARVVRAAAGLPWLALLVGSVIPVGITYSRAALGAVALATAALLPRARSDVPRRLVTAAIVVGVGVPALLTASGWLARGEQFGEERPDSSRGILLLQGLVVFSMDPLIGVGPGQYMARVRTLTDDEGIRRMLGPTHDVPLLVAAESGVVAGAAIVVLLAALGLRVLRDRDDVAFGLYIVLLPFWLLDVVPYTLPQGVILTGLWLGALDVLHRDGSI
jgi:hypothetical protein